MLLSCQEQAPHAWAELHFDACDLSDLRRAERVVMIAEAMALNPGASIPRLFARWSDVKAAYTLFKHEEVTPDALHAGHRELVAAHLAVSGTYLLIEDTTEVAWAGRRCITGLGMVGNGSEMAQGFLLHSVIAAHWSCVVGTVNARRSPVRLIGLADQQYYIRQPRPVGEADDAWQARQLRARESQLWEWAGERIGAAPEADNVRWVRVCDRGADIYEFLRACAALGHGFVVRAAQDRGLVEPESGKQVGRLFETARTASRLARFDLELRARPKHAARTARLSVGAAEVHLRAPQRPGKSTGRLPAVPCTVVRVWEEQPPPETAPLEWILLCDGVRTSAEQSRECASQYAARWLIEDFHKALKSGLGAERLQLKTAAELFAAIAIMSVVAVRLVEVRFGGAARPRCAVRRQRVEHHGTCCATRGGGARGRNRARCRSSAWSHGWTLEPHARWRSGLAHAHARDDETEHSC